jgi:MFS family permease
VRSVREYYHEYNHYAWLIVAIATILQVTTGFVSQAFAVLMVQLEEDLSWTLTAITLAYFLRSVIGAVLAPVAGWIGDRYGARRAMLVGVFLYVIGMLLLSRIGSIWELYLYYSFILGVSQALFMVNIPTTVAAWFRKRLGRAVGIQQSAGGMGAAVMAPALAYMLGFTDWQTTFMIIPAVGGVIILSLLFLFHSDPADKGMKPYGSTEDDPPTVSSTDPGIAKVRSQVFLRHARRTRAFWNLIAIHHLGCLGHSIIMVGVVLFATTTKGMSLEAASIIITIYSACSIVGRLATPMIADRYGAKWVMVVAYFIQGASVAMLFWVQVPWQFYSFAVIFGIGFGGEMSAFLVINRQYYGMGPVRTVYGFQSMGAGLGMALGGLLVGIIFDTFGSYDIAWIISIAASMAGVLVILTLEPTSRMLIPNWEDSLPEEARSPSPTQREAPPTTTPRPAEAD